MLEIAEAIDRHGVSIVITAVVVWALVWGARRLLNAKDGILTRVAEKVVEFISATAECQQSLTQSVSKLSDEAVVANETSQQQVEHLEAIVARQDGIARAGRRACDVLEAICKELGIGDASKQSIAEIRRELDAALPRQPVDAAH
jgi:uncharacterized protein YyaL (SSP411 family)